MRRSATLCCWMLLTSTVAWATGPDRSKLPAPSGETVWSPPSVDTWSMKNGMTVWFMEVKGAPLVSLRLVTAKGAGTDPAEKSRAASLMIDMMDEGAGSRNALELSEAFQLLATDYSSSAGTDGLMFSMEMLADNVEPSLTLLADVLLRPTLPEAEFKRRKAQRLASTLSEEANLGVVANWVRARAIYGSGLGGHPANGRRNALKEISLEDVKTSYAALVKPAGSTVVVVGNIEKSRIKTALQKALGQWQGEPDATLRAEDKQTEYQGLHLVDFPGAAQSVVMLARPVAGTQADDYYSALVFNRPFSGSFTGRVNMNLREDKGYTYGARGAFRRTRSHGTYLIYAKVKRDTTRASINEMLKELSDVRGSRPLTEKELSNAKGGLRKSFPGRFERISSVSQQLATLVLDGYPSDRYTRWPTQVGQIDLANARKSAQRYTNPDEFAIIVAGDLTKIGESLEGLSKSVRYYDSQGRLKPTESSETKK
jgi:zinc protease